MLVAVFTIPELIRILGKDRFGVLALVWAVIGYASLFDLGLGRALTQLVAKKLEGDDHRDLPALAWTSLLLLLLLGVLGMAAIELISPWLVNHAFKIPEGLRRETIRCFYLLSLSLPVVFTTAGLRGLLEAHQRFALINGLRIPMGVFSFGSPLLPLLFSHSLVPVVAILVVGRVLACIAHLLACLRVLPELRHPIVWRSAAAGPLLSFGGWMTVSNLVNPLMVMLDRFLIGALVSVAAVTYYATPYEVVTRLLFIPSAVMGVMFPAFSSSFAVRRDWTAILYSRSVKYLFLLLFPVVLLSIGLAREGLSLWLGRDFAQHSVRVLQWLAAGVFVNSLAQVPFAFLQGMGRPDLTAKLHLLEFPCYLLTLGWLVSTRGIEGAAITWAGRAALDGFCLFWVSRRFLSNQVMVTLRNTSLLLVALLMFWTAALPQGLLLRGILLGVIMLGFGLASWFLIFTPEERGLAQGVLNGPSQEFAKTA